VLDIDTFNFFINLLAAFFIAMAFLGFTYKVTLHLFEITSVPFYLGMIMIECFTQHFETRFFKFRRPDKHSTRFLMNSFSTITSLVGTLLILPNYSAMFQSTKSHFLTLISPSLSVSFLVLVSIVYGFNWYAPDDEREPMQKLRELGIPGFLAKWLNTSPK
jgi:hypothetical protein